jgi:hypothetical protein
LEFNDRIKQFVFETTFAVRGQSNRTPISPKYVPGFNEAYVASPSNDLMHTRPFTSQYIAFASSPSVIMYVSGGTRTDRSLVATLFKKEGGAFLNTVNSFSKSKTSEGSPSTDKGDGLLGAKPLRPRAVSVCVTIKIAAALASRT